jgi:hypothetical protein
MEASADATEPLARTAAALVYDDQAYPYESLKRVVDIDECAACVSPA